MNTIPNIEEGVFQLMSASTSQVINNSNGREWIYVENRSSWPLALGVVPPNSGATPSFPFTVRALSIGCYPINPNGDIVIGNATNTVIQQQTQGGVNTGSGPVHVPQPRNILYKLMDTGAPFVTHLYPIDTAWIVSHYRANFVGGGTLTHDVLSLGASPDVFLFPPTGVDNPQDMCIIAAQVTLLSMGSAASPNNIQADLVAVDNTGGLTLMGTIFPYNGLGNDPSTPFTSPLIAVPGVFGFAWQNTNPAVNGSVNIAIAYSIGVPARFPGGTI